MEAYRVALRRSDGSVLRDAPLTALQRTPVASLLPWREPQNYHGQSHLTGLAYLSTTGQHVLFESRLEQLALLRLDHDPGTRHVTAQPFLLTWSLAGETVGHVPDLLVERRGRRPLVADVKPSAFVDKPHNVAAFTATRQACSQIGWAYEVWSEPSVTFAHNLRWLAAASRPPFEHAVYRPALLALLRGQPRTIGELAGALEPEGLVRASLFHLMWRREVITDLEVMLGNHTLVRLA